MTKLFPLATTLRGVSKCDSYSCCSDAGRPPSLPFTRLILPPLLTLNSTSNPTFFSLCLSSDDIRNMIYDSWRTQLQPIRTIGEITVHIEILSVHQSYLYQKLSKKATQLHLLGMSYEEIATSLNINKKTATKACKYHGK